MPDFMGLAESFGLFAALTVFFVYKDWQREKRLNERIDAVIQKDKEMLMKLLRKTTKTLALNNITIQHNSIIVERCISVIEKMEAAIIGRTIREQVSDADDPADHIRT